jgi:hypothetical protein
LTRDSVDDIKWISLSLSLSLSLSVSLSRSLSLSLALSLALCTPGSPTHPYVQFLPLEVMGREGGGRKVRTLRAGGVWHRLEGPDLGEGTDSTFFSSCQRHLRAAGAAVFSDTCSRSAAFSAGLLGYSFAVRRRSSLRRNRGLLFKVSVLGETADRGLLCRGLL